MQLESLCSEKVTLGMIILCQRLPVFTELTEWSTLLSCSGEFYQIAVDVHTEWCVLVRNLPF